MIWVLLVLLILILFKIKYCKDGFDDYLAKDQTTCIKGIFVLIIFLSHFNSYASEALHVGILNNIYLQVFNYISQLMVVPFLFYSGYSICYSIENKKDYIKKFPKNRFLKLLMQFDLAVILYLIMNIVMNNIYPLKTILLSFVGWKSIGNSNWFVFSLLCLYVLSYFVFKIFKSKINIKSLLLMLLGTIILIIILWLKKESWWYDILLSYPCGMFVYLYREKIKSLLKKGYFIILILLTLIFVVGHFYSSKLILYELLACVFAILIMVITYRFKIQNKILLFIGNLSFEIYILQRIPDIILSKVIPTNPILFCAICFALTLGISIVFNKLFKLVSKYIFN